MSELDVDRFVAICTSAGEDVAALAEFYLSYMSEQLDALRSAIAGDRIAEVRQIAHRCAGSSGTYGMQPIVAPLAALERAARDGDLREAPALERQARAAFEQIETGLRALVSEHTKQP